MIGFYSIFFLFLVSGDPAPSLEQLAKEKSPKAMMKVWVMAMISGDLETVKSGFDLSNDQERASAAFVLSTVRMISASNKLSAATQTKYGKPGIEMVEKTLMTKLGEKVNLKDVQPTIDGIKIFLAEDDETAVARMAGSKEPWTYTELERKNGRWFISQSTKNSDQRQLFSALTSMGASQMEEATKIIEKSKTIEEARALLEKLQKESEKTSKDESATPKKIK